MRRRSCKEGPRTTVEKPDFRKHGARLNGGNAKTRQKERILRESEGPKNCLEKLSPVFCKRVEELSICSRIPSTLRGCGFEITLQRNRRSVIKWMCKLGRRENPSKSELV